MKTILKLFILLLLFGCKKNVDTQKQTTPDTSEKQTTPDTSDSKTNIKYPEPFFDIRVAHSDILAVFIKSGPHMDTTAANSFVNDSVSDWKVNGQSPVDLFRYSVPYDALLSENGQYPIYMLHRFFLKLENPLAQESNYDLETPYGEVNFTFDDRLTICDSIKVNQAGYHQDSTMRYANFGVYLGDGGSLFLEAPPSYKVYNESDGSLVYSGQGVYMGDDTTIETNVISSGEHVYRLNLAQVPPDGPYFVSVDGCGRSRSFGIGTKYSREIARTLARGLYHQRCTIALEEKHTRYTRETCHQEVGDTRTPWSMSQMITVPPLTPMVHIAGGYHDAGDFDRRPMHTIIPLLMLSYFEAFPTHFIDGQYNIPESGNGIPDFLDEALWGVLLFESLQIDDTEDPSFGGVRMGTEANAHPNSRNNAAADTLIYGTFDVGEEVTAISAGLFAHASRLLEPYDSQRADDLLRRARRAWAYLDSNFNVKAHETRYMYAALQLYLTTGEELFHNLFKDAADSIVLQEGTWPEQYMPGNTSAKCNTAHFSSYFLQDENIDEQFKDKLVETVLATAQRGTYMGPPPDDEPYPQGVTKFMGWGAATAQGRYAQLWVFANLLTQDNDEKQKYFNIVSQYADFSLGLNPMNMSFTTGLGTDQPQSPLHQDSYHTKWGMGDHEGNPIGNVPGIVIYGPTQGHSNARYQLEVVEKLYPSWNELPTLRRFGDAWPLINSCEFTTWETMVWNVVMHGFLYNAGNDSSAQYKGTD